MSAKAEAPKPDAKAKNVAAAAAKVDKKDLDHITPPNDNPTVTHARVENAVKKGKKLKDAPKPKEGPSDAVKQAFKEDRKEKASAKK